MAGAGLGLPWLQLSLQLATLSAGNVAAYRRGGAAWSLPAEGTEGPRPGPPAAPAAVIDTISSGSTLRYALTYFGERWVREIVSFQCSAASKAELLRAASARQLPVRFHGGRRAPRRDEDLRHNRIGVFVNVSCPGSVRWLRDASLSLRFNSSFVWFIADPLGLHQDEYAGELLVLSELLNLAADSAVALASPQLAGVFEVYKAYYHLPLRVTPLHEIHSAAARQQRENLTGLTIRAVGEAIRGSRPGWNQFPLYLEGFILDEDPNGIFKQGARLFDLIRGLYNFTLTMRTVSAEAGSAGSTTKGFGGSCGGIAGLLQRGDFEVALQLWMDKARLPCVQYAAYNLVTFESALVYRMPTRSSSAVNSQVTPFSSGSWGGVFLMFGMMALLLLIADEFHLEEAFGNLGPWSAALIFGTAGISWGSVHYGINSTHLISVELGTVIGGLTYTVIFTYYQSSVVFGLLAKDSRPALTPQEVLEKEYRIMSDDSAFFVDLFETTNDSDLQEIHRRFLSTGSGPGSNPGFVSLRQGARLVRDEQVALVGDSAAVAKQLNPIMTSQQLCTMRYTRIAADRSLLYSAARREWPLADLVKRGLLLALERGLSRRIVRPFRMPCSGDDSTASTTTISAFTVPAATTAYAVLFAGFVVVSSICALETVGPLMERSIDRFLETRRLSVLFERRERRRTRKWSRLVAEDRAAGAALGLGALGLGAPPWPATSADSALPTWFIH